MCNSIILYEIFEKPRCKMHVIFVNFSLCVFILCIWTSPLDCFKIKMPFKSNIPNPIKPDILKSIKPIVPMASIQNIKGLTDKENKGQVAKEVAPAAPVPEAKNAPPPAPEPKKEANILNFKPKVESLQKAVDSKLNTILKLADGKNIAAAVAKQKIEQEIRAKGFANQFNSKNKGLLFKH